MKTKYKVKHRVQSTIYSYKTDFTYQEFCWMFFVKIIYETRYEARMCLHTNIFHSDYTLGVVL